MTQAEVAAFLSGARTLNVATLSPDGTWVLQVVAFKATAGTATPTDTSTATATPTSTFTPTSTSTPTPTATGNTTTPQSLTFGGQHPAWARKADVSGCAVHTGLGATHMLNGTIETKPCCQ